MSRRKENKGQASPPAPGSCPLCGGSEFTPAAAGFRECDNCHHIYPGPGADPMHINEVVERQTGAQEFSKQGATRAQMESEVDQLLHGPGFGSISERLRGSVSEPRGNQDLEDLQQKWMKKASTGPNVATQKQAPWRLTSKPDTSPHYVAPKQPTEEGRSAALPENLRTGGPRRPATTPVAPPAPPAPPQVPQFQGSGAELVSSVGGAPTPPAPPPAPPRSVTQHVLAAPPPAPTSDVAETDLDLDFEGILDGVGATPQLPAPPPAPALPAATMAPGSYTAPAAADITSRLTSQADGGFQLRVTVLNRGTVPMRSIHLQARASTPQVSFDDSLKILPQLDSGGEDTVVFIVSRAGFAGEVSFGVGCKYLCGTDPAFVQAQASPIQAFFS